MTKDSSSELPETINQLLNNMAEFLQFDKDEQYYLENIIKKTLAIHIAQSNQELLKRIEGELPKIPFVSFEACRTTADYDERQALRKLLSEVQSIINAIKAEI